MTIVGVIAVIFSASCFIFAQTVYWYDLCEYKLRLDEFHRNEGQEVPERKGFWWWLFLKIRTLLK